MKLVFSRHAWEDYLYWQKTDRRIVRRINALIESIRRRATDSSAVYRTSSTHFPTAFLQPLREFPYAA